MSALSLFGPPVASGQTRPPVGEYTQLEKPTDPPFAPELAARALTCLGDEWKWVEVSAIHADPQDPIRSALIGTRVSLAVPTKKRNGDPSFPPKRAWRTVIVTELQERDALAAWERARGVCGGCGGDGLRLAGFRNGEGSKYRVCDRCGGSGVPPQAGAA